MRHHTSAVRLSEGVQLRTTADFFSYRDCGHGLGEGDRQLQKVIALNSIFHRGHCQIMLVRTSSNSIVFFDLAS
jgi:hypothetical protein